MRYARHVHRDLPRPPSSEEESDGTGCGIIILLVLFFVWTAVKTLSKPTPK